jgi:hypothetical protein
MRALLNCLGIAAVIIASAVLLMEVNAGFSQAESDKRSRVLEARYETMQETAPERVIVIRIPR